MRGACVCRGDWAGPPAPRLSLGSWVLEQGSQERKRGGHLRTRIALLHWSSITGPTFKGREFRPRLSTADAPKNLEAQFQTA